MPEHVNYLLKAVWKKFRSKLTPWVTNILPDVYLCGLTKHNNKTFQAWLKKGNGSALNSPPIDNIFPLPHIMY